MSLPTCDAIGLYHAAAELSATAADLAANLAEGRACPHLITRAYDLLDTLAADLGGDDPGQPVPYTLTAKARAALIGMTQ